MRQFLEFLLREPLLLILLGGWLISLVGNALTRKAAPPGQQGRQPGRPQGAPPRPQQVERPSRQLSAEDIAGEIRRAMAGEAQPSHPAAPPRAQEAPRPQSYAERALGEQRRRHAAAEAKAAAARREQAEARARTLEERLRQKSAAAAEKQRQRDREREQKRQRLGQLQARGDAKRDAGPSSPQLGQLGGKALTGGRPSARPRVRAAAVERRPARLLDLRRPAAAFVHMEVFAAPRALRPYEPPN